MRVKTYAMRMRGYSSAGLTSIRIGLERILVFVVCVVFELFDPIIQGLIVAEEEITHIHVHCRTLVVILLVARSIGILGIPGVGSHKVLCACFVQFGIGVGTAINIDQDLKWCWGDFPSLSKGFGVVEHLLDFGLVVLWAGVRVCRNRALLL